MFFPVNAQYAISDGTAAPGGHGAPANLRNFTPFHRSGFEVGATHATFARGRAGRGAGEHGRLRYYDAAISPGVVEADDTATIGTTVLFPVNDARYDNERVFQRTYEGSLTDTVNCVVSEVTPDAPDNDVLMLNVSLMATGTITRTGF